MTAKSALIGHTGFVGGNLLEQHEFSLLFNSKNINEIAGKNIDTLVCAGVSGVKWLANKEPDKDLAAIQDLIEKIKTAAVKKFILISTIDVYPETGGVNEDSQINTDMLLPYGRNRRLLEEFVEKNYHDHLIVRLPGLFGNGLKKNPIFDLIKGESKFINKNSVFQFYNLANLWRDIEQAQKNGSKVINLATEPISIERIAKEIFSVALPDPDGTPPVNYDIHTKYAEDWNKSGNYLYSSEEILGDLKKFVKKFKI